MEVAEGLGVHVRLPNQIRKDRRTRANFRQNIGKYPLVKSFRYLGVEIDHSGKAGRAMVLDHTGLKCCCAFFGSIFFQLVSQNLLHVWK